MLDSLTRPCFWNWYPCIAVWHVLHTYLSSVILFTDATRSRDGLLFFSVYMGFDRYMSVAVLYGCRMHPFLVCLMNHYSLVCLWRSCCLTPPFSSFQYFGATTWNDVIMIAVIHCRDQWQVWHLVRENMGAATIPVTSGNRRCTITCL